MCSFAVRSLPFAAAESLETLALLKAPAGESILARLLRPPSLFITRALTAAAVLLRASAGELTREAAADLAKRFKDQLHIYDREAVFKVNLTVVHLPS